MFLLQRCVYFAQSTLLVVLITYLHTFFVRKYKFLEHTRYDIKRQVCSLYHSV